MKALLLFLAVLVAGCAMTNPNISRKLTSGAIGCPADEVAIRGETADIIGNHNWAADCRGKSFVCHFHQSSGVNCKEPIGQASN